MWLHNDSIFMTPVCDVKKYVTENSQVTVHTTQYTRSDKCLEKNHLLAGKFSNGVWNALKLLGKEVKPIAKTVMNN